VIHEIHFSISQKNTTEHRIDVFYRFSRKLIKITADSARSLSQEKYHSFMLQKIFMHETLIHDVFAW
jgi:hypothetical protein